LRIGAPAVLSYASYPVSGNGAGSIWIAIVAFFIAIVCSSAIKIADQWEKAVILRLGRFYSIKGPGLFFIIPVY